MLVNLLIFPPRELDFFREKLSTVVEQFTPCIEAASETTPVKGNLSALLS